MSLIKAHHCCETKPEGDRHRTGFGRRFLRVSEWLLPGVVLAILPKCPLCIVAYVAVGTGIGLSVSTAANARLLILIICIAALAFFAAKHIYLLIAPIVRMLDAKYLHRPG